MKKLMIVFAFLLSTFIVSAQNLKPYILGVKSPEKAETLKLKLADALVNNELEVVGEYKVSYQEDTWVVVFTSVELQQAVHKIGGLTGFAATLRIAITSEGENTIVSYTTPEYWGNAYFRKNYDKVASVYTKISSQLKAAIGTLGTYDGSGFGSKDGISVKDIRDYQYMFGMPEFDDTEELAQFDSFEAAIAKIDASVKSGVSSLQQVYKLSIPESELVLYGFGLTASDGEQKFMPIIDGSSPKHTAFLPYELLVMGNEVHMLHGRYRIALSFPDLTMGTFTKIMSTPGYIEDTLEKLIK